MVKPYEGTYQKGIITFEQFMFDKVVPSARVIEGDVSIQIAEDGRIWINVDGICFLRFKPLSENLSKYFKERKGGVLSEQDRKD